MLRSLCALAILVPLVTSDLGEGNFRVLYKSLEKCGNVNELGTCLRLKAVSLLEKALKSDVPLVINEYLTLTPDQDIIGNTTVQSENEIEAELPKDQDVKDSKLDGMIADKMSKFLQSRSIQFTVPANFEGRKKGGKGKGGMVMMAAMAMGGMMVQMAMGKIALLAGKALLVGKMALLLSAIIGLKKLVGSGGGGDSHPQVVYAESHGGGHGGGWGRSIKGQEDENKANEMAYKAQARSH